MTKFKEIRTQLDFIESFLDGEWQLFHEATKAADEISGIFDRINAKDIANEFDLTPAQVLKKLIN